MTYDVVIAGAGPVGLFLACELRLAGCSVLVLEAAADPASPLKAMPFGMRGLWGPSVEAFDRRGLLEQVAAQREASGGPGQPRPAAQGPAGHFAGIQFDFRNIDQARWTYRLPGPSDLQLGASMEHLESVLAARAHELGVELRRGQAVTAYELGDEIAIGDVRARWLVGCDGGRSAVRKLAGIDFAGTEPELTGYSLKVELEGAVPLGRHATPTGMYTQWQPGVFGLAEFDGGAHHRAEVTLAHAQAVLRRVTGIDVTVRALSLAATWTDRSRQATTYRKGRVLLAGDAAHVHSPLGGQGLNLGLGDAMNLGWKLGAVVRGDAPDGLLDTYTAERHPIGARILDWTRAQVAAMRPSSAALAAVLRDLIDTREGATYFAERVWGVMTRYELGGDHPLIGRSCPDFALVDGTRVGERLRAGRALLLDFDGVMAGAWPVEHVAVTARERLGLSAVLVRPDGFVAWASDGAPDVEAARRAVHQLVRSSAATARA